MMVGLFDLPGPLFSIVDAGLRAALPQWGCLAVWGMLAGTTSMTIYRAVSPQKRIGEIKQAALQAQIAMRNYDGDFDGLLPLARRSLGLAMLHLALALGPAIAASLPALFLIAYLDGSYGYSAPRPGAAIAVRITPHRAPVAWNPATAANGADGVFTVRWPVANAPVTVTSAGGVTLASFPLRQPVPELRKFTAWNWLYGNPAGYIPASTIVNAITLDVAPSQYLPAGPGWLRGWETVFFLSAAFASILIKVRLGVH
jgi:hypothetical protein